MKMVTLEVRSLKHALRGAAETARSGKADKSARISFASPELLWEVLTAKRWEILRALTGAEPLSIREIARRVSAYDEWRELIERGDDGELYAAMLGRDARANRLRQSPPYAGLLPREEVRKLNEKAAA